MTQASSSDTSSPEGDQGTIQVDLDQLAQGLGEETVDFEDIELGLPQPRDTRRSTLSHQAIRDHVQQTTLANLRDATTGPISSPATTIRGQIRRGATTIQRGLNIAGRRLSLRSLASAAA